MRVAVPGTVEWLRKPLSPDMVHTASHRLQSKAAAASMSPAEDAEDAGEEEEEEEEEVAAGCDSHAKHLLNRGNQLRRGGSWVDNRNMEGNKLWAPVAIAA